MNLLRVLFITLLTLCQLSAKDAVILLHGLARSSASMKQMERSLKKAGFVTENVSYPSRSAPIAELAEEAIGTALKSAQLRTCPKIHFVTHSLGGILVRSYFSNHQSPRLGRVVMLAPPNQGSEVIDKIGRWKVTKLISGPAGSELSTAASSTPNQLGTITFECGVLAGDRSINWINSLMIPGKDDGKVSIVRSKAPGLKDHRVLRTSHPFIMRNREAILETRHFLLNGSFTSAP